MQTPFRLSWMLCAVLGSTALACGGGNGNGDDNPGSDGGGGGDDGGGGGGNGDGGGGGGGEACRHLDVLFAVDPSGSMQEEMTAMADEIFGGPNGFANALLGIADGIDDYQAGTIDACPNPAILHTQGAGGECNFESGERWIVGTPARDPNDVIAEFECVGDIWDGDIACDTGSADEDEQPALAALAALEPPYIDNENAGFVRDNALLVVVAITDEDEELAGTGGNPTTVEGLYNELVAVKGDVNNMVFLGIGGGPPDGCDAQQGAYGAALYASNLHQLTNMFIAQQRGVFFDLCDGNLGDGLSQAIEVIQQACEDFNPVD